MLSYIRTLLVCLFCPGLLSVGFGQDAQIQGQVLDPSGSAILKAIVRVVDQQAGKERITETNDNGQYTVPALAPGAYKIFVQAPGFSAAASDQITLNQGQSAVLNFTLKVGATSADVVVTAQKREERLQDVPISMSVINGADLDTSLFSSVTDALSFVPGVATRVDYNGEGATIVVRGVTPPGIFEAGSGTIGYYLDSIPFGLVKSAVAPDSNPYDLDRVEVLRGPQGTLYGANSEGGLIRVLTKEPNLDAFELTARAMVSNTDGGGENYRGDLAINIPIIRDRLAARAVTGYEHLSGWVDSPNKNGVNSGVLRNFRLKIEAKPTKPLTMDLSAWSTRDDLGAPSTSNDQGRITSLLPQPVDDGYDADSFKVGYRLPQLSVSDTASYLHYTNTFYQDLIPDGLPPSTVPPGSQCVASAAPVPNVPIGAYCSMLYSLLASNLISDELLLNSANATEWRWSAGAFYRDGKDHLVQTLPAYIPAPIDFNDISRSVAVFGQVGRRFLANRVELTLGLRYFHDEATSKENIQSQAQPNAPLGSQTEPSQAVTPHVALTWYPDENHTVYASYSQGFRSGAPQNPNVLDQYPGVPTYKPDRLNNYEIGAKGALLNRRFSYDGAVYYMKWYDIQTTLSFLFDSVPVAGIVNGKSASGIGVDLALTTHVLGGLDAGVTGNWNNLRQDDDVYSGGTILYSKGARLPESPAYTSSAFANYSFPMAGSSLKGQLSATANYTASDNETGVLNGVFQPINGPGLPFVNANVAIESSKGWAVRLFSENLTNDRRAVLERFPADWASRSQPRTVGAQFEYRFK